MKVFLFICSFYCSHSIATEWLVGIGDIYQADESGYKMYSLSAEKGIWKANISHWETYPKTAWLETNPEWGIDYVESHYMLSLVGTLLQYEVSNEWRVFFDFGVTYTSKLSKSNSSDISFQENLGIAYKNFRLYLRHTSNGDIKPPNYGEDALVFEMGFNF
jgi:hypothetical protein